MADTVEFEFEKWAKDAELTSKTAAILDEEDINCITALLAFEVGDITSLEITKGQQAVLKQALLKLKNDHSGKNKAVQEPVTTKDLKDIEILSDMLSLLSTNASSDSIKTVIRGEGKQALYIRDFVMGSLGLVDNDYEQNILQSGGQSLTLKSSNKPKTENVTVEQWVSANARIMNNMLQSGELNLTNISQYISHTEQIGEYFQIYDIPNVMLYDHRFRELVSKGAAIWGNPDIHGIGFFLRPKVKPLEKSNPKCKMNGNFKRDNNPRETKERPIQLIILGRYN